MTRSRNIQASSAGIWAVLADFAAIGTWADNVDHSRVLNHLDANSASVGNQARIGLTRRVQIGRNTVLERVVQWHAPTSLAYQVEGLPPVLRSVRNQWALAPTDDDSTLVTLTTTIDAGVRPPQQLIARFAGRQLAKASEAMLAGLATHMEASSRV